MITVAIAPLTTAFFIAIRLGTVLLFAPIEAIRTLPIHARLLLVLGLSLLIVSALPVSSTMPDDWSLWLGGLAELVNGLILSLSLYATFAIFQIAGQLIDTQMGLNSLAIFNPGDHSHDPLSARLMTMLAVLFFFASNGHHQLIQSLALSFMLILPGKMAIFTGFASILRLFAAMFSLGLMIASPLIAGLLIIDIAGSVLTRNMPQLSIYFLTLPIKILLGLFLFYLLVGQLNPLMENSFQWCFQTIKQVLL